MYHEQRRNGNAQAKNEIQKNHGRMARFWQGKENEARTKHEKTPKFYPSVKDPTAKKKQ